MPAVRNWSRATSGYLTPCTTKRAEGNAAAGPIRNSCNSRLRSSSPQFPTHTTSLDFGADCGWNWRVGRLVKRPNLLHAESLVINPPDGLAKRQHPVAQVQAELQDVTRAAVGAVVRVMKQYPKAEGALERENGVHQFGPVPLVQNDHVSATKLFGKKGPQALVNAIKANIQLRERGPELPHGFLRQQSFVVHEAGN